MDSVRWAKPARVSSVDRVVRFGEVAGSVHLTQEEQLVDLAKGPVRSADADAGEIGGEVGSLVRRQPPDDQIAVGRAGSQLRSRRLAGARARGDGARPRPGPGGRPPNRPRP